MRVRTRVVQAGRTVVAARGAKEAEKEPAKAPDKRHENEFTGLTQDARYHRAIDQIREKYAPVPIAMEAIGLIVFQACHDEVAAAALADEAEENKLYRRIATTVETLKIGLGQERLSLARRIAAVSHSTDSHFWDHVSYSHKEELVALKDVDEIVAGAKHVFEMGLSVRATENWVALKRKENGDEPVKRGVNLSTTRTSLVRVATAVEPESLDKIDAAFEKLSEEEQAKVLQELDEAAAAIQRLRRKLKKR